MFAQFVSQSGLDHEQIGHGLSIGLVRPDTRGPLNVLFREYCAAAACGQGYGGSGCTGHDLVGGIERNIDLGVPGGVTGEKQTHGQARPTGRR